MLLQSSAETHISVGFFGYLLSLSVTRPLPLSLHVTCVSKLIPSKGE